jgi:ABC-type dipeptide/oligopeptide/nickel transport system permease component
MFGKFIAKSLTGQFGISLETQQPICCGLMMRFPTTLLLLGSSMIILMLNYRIRHLTDISISKLVKSVGCAISAIIIFEVAFNWPGIGSWFFRSIIRMDYPVAQACFIMLSTIAILTMFILDISLKISKQRSESVHSLL